MRALQSDGDWNLFAEIDHFRAAAIHEKQMLADVGDREQDAIAASGTDFFASGERAIDLERKRRSAGVRHAEGHAYGALALGRAPWRARGGPYIQTKQVDVS